MPTQRPFLTNFLAAFRAHSQQLPKAAPSSAAITATSTQTIWTSASASAKTQPTTTNSEPNTISTPKPINPKAAAAQVAQDRQLHPALQHNVSPQTHLPRSPSSPGPPVYGPQNKQHQPSYPTAAESRPWAESRRARRGSDSSSDSGGWREVKGGGEKWFVGGRTASGEEKYYKLSMVKRDRSSDRISADQLSL